MKDVEDIKQLSSTSFILSYSSCERLEDLASPWLVRPADIDTHPDRVLDPAVYGDLQNPLVHAARLHHFRVDVEHDVHLTAARDGGLPRLEPHRSAIDKGIHPFLGSRAQRHGPRDHFREFTCDVEPGRVQGNPGNVGKP